MSLDGGTIRRLVKSCKTPKICAAGEVIKNAAAPMDTVAGESLMVKCSQLLAKRLSVDVGCKAKRGSWQGT